MNSAWQIKKLGEVCTIIAGQSPEGNFYNENGGGLPFYQGKKEFGERFIGSPTTWTTQITKVAEKDDILMCVRAPVGPINFATEKICIGRGLAIIRSGDLINKDFLFYFLSLNEENIVGNAGAVFASISKKDIENIEIPLPPLAEQKRIVKILDEVFEGIAKVKENTEKNLQNVKELFESYLQSIFSDPREGWEVRNFDECIDKVIYTNKIQRKYFLEDGKFPIISQEKDLINGYWDKKDDLFHLKKPIIIFGDHTKILKYIDFDFVLGADGVKVLQPKDFLFPKLFYYFLRSITLKKLGYARHYRLLIEKHVVYPKSLLEQKKIVAKLDALSEQTKKLEGIYKQKLLDLEELKKSVLKKAFCGEL
jgi:type I restriction enzyme S subunit